MSRARNGLSRALAGALWGVALIAAPLYAGDPAPAPATAPAPTAPSTAGAPAPRALAGDLRFHAAATAYRHGAEKAFVEVTIRVPYQEIRFVPEGEDRFNARLRLTVELRSSRGKRAGYLQREAHLQSTDFAATVDSLLGEVYALGFSVPPGEYSYEVLVEDMNQDRQGLVYKMKNQKRQGKATGRIDAGSWLFHSPAISGLEFAWEIRERRDSDLFAKGPYEVMPHPSALYGHFQDVLSFYCEIYDDPVPPEGREYLIANRILNAAGDTVFTTVDSLRVTEGQAWPHVLSLETGSLPSGHYSMLVTIEGEDGAVRAASQGKFEVIWSVDSWRPDAADFYDVTASTLLPSDSLSLFRALSLGEQERWVERIWRAVDPSPDTGDNEKREEFRRRVHYANARYTIFQPGMFSDRGRVYIRYGEPDDIKIERIPVDDKTLGYAIGSDIPTASKKQITDTGTGVGDMRAYEIWKYDFKGREFVPRFGMNDLNSTLKFIFVDDQGYGEYRMEYSSTTGIH